MITYNNINSRPYISITEKVTDVDDPFDLTNCLILEVLSVAMRCARGGYPVLAHTIPL